MSNKVFIIAEAGVNHNGSVEIAKQLVDVAVDSGADAIKFQTFKAEKLVIKSAEKAEYQKKNTDKSETQFDMFCKERNIHHFIINSENGSKYLCSRSLNQLLLKDPKDKIEEKNLNWTFIRMPWFYFPKN